MKKKQSQKRTYDSPLRRQQQEMTTETIMAAVEELILQGHIHNFTIQNVAKLAGVSYASVYRHFPSREALVQRYRDLSLEQVSPPPYVDDLDNLPTWIEQTIPLFFKSLPRAKALFVAMTALQINQVHPQSQDRDEWITRLVKDATLSLPDDIRKASCLIIRLLVSMSSWVEYHTRYGLDESEIILTVKEGIRAQIEYLRSAEKKMHE